MQQQNQGKITIQQGQKNGEELVWGAVVGETEFQYLGEAREALNAINWETAEEICGRRLDDSFAILFKVLENKAGTWKEDEERVLLYMISKEQESLQQDRDGE
ncbi:hypothetical protein [Pedobacter sp. SYSU D00535]|uniref:hypothetical protein n=1 Tax=Pedobacter sp. SYSU D00535 TaxID=2810308 RepID=UPI001A966EC5|nr:hypothetical protein [Pedobacter sp. SYSU D00535]